jgi:hypothetical protein
MVINLYFLFAVVKPSRLSTADVRSLLSGSIGHTSSPHRRSGQHHGSGTGTINSNPLLNTDMGDGEHNHIHNHHHNDATTTAAAAAAAAAASLQSSNVSHRDSYESSSYSRNGSTSSNSASLRGSRKSRRLSSADVAALLRGSIHTE